MTLLSAVNNAQRILSLTVTATVIADGQETQNLLLGLANVGCDDILRREFYWPLLTRTASFTATLASAQLDGLPSDYKFAIPNTFWNRTTRRPIGGPLNSQEWAIANGSPVTSSISQWVMFRYNALHIFPVPTAADTISYDYIINAPVYSPLIGDAAAPFKTSFTADTDTAILGDGILTLDLIWRYKQSKGRDYAEDQRNFELALSAEYESQRGAGRVLSLSPADETDPGATIPMLPAVFG